MTCTRCRRLAVEGRTTCTAHFAFCELARHATAARVSPARPRLATVDFMGAVVPNFLRALGLRDALCELVDGEN